ncbi:MAG: TIGR03009 domain-containing protein [Planctomycetaceae bacterium]|nr:TIGR03009 domain-containing protein [Planctomycetaceae bacterium]
MRLRFISYMVTGLVLAAASAMAQTNPVRGPEGQDGGYGPDQPIRQQVPRLLQRPPEPPMEQRPGERPGGPQPGAQQPGPQQQPGMQPPNGQQQPGARQPAAPQQPPPPFTLTPEQQAEVDRVLKQWEDHNSTIKTFECDFKRWIFNVVFAAPGQQLKPQFVEQGKINYASPDKGLFRIDTEEKDGKQAPIDSGRAEHWLCDGTSIYQYIPAKKRVEEHRLPPELRGKAIANSPLPFIFGAEAQNLKQRYFIRLVTPPPDVNGQYWLEAYPRYQQDGANFARATFIISTKDLSPLGLELIQPNGKDFVRYRFDEIVINAKWRPFKGDPFRPFTPWGWQMVPDQTQTPAQAQTPPADGRR